MAKKPDQLSNLQIYVWFGWRVMATGHRDAQLSLSSDRPGSGAQRGFKKGFCSLPRLLEFHWAVCKNPHWNRIYVVLFSKNYRAALLNKINGAVESASLANSPQEVQKLLSGVLDEGKSSFCLDDQFRRVVSDHSVIVAHTISSLTLLHSGTEDRANWSRGKTAVFYCSGRRC